MSFYCKEGVFRKTAYSADSTERREDSATGKLLFLRGSRMVRSDGIGKSI